MEHDAVNHPKHYTSHPLKCICGRQVECIDVIEDLDYNIGAAIKYLWRQGLKGGRIKAIEDMSKAIWYINREIQRQQSKLKTKAKEIDSALRKTQS